MPEAGAVVAVEGLADGDLLNLRATAGAGGLVLERLPNGALLKNLGCREFGGYDWCEVEAVDRAGLKGWTPARYLAATDIAPPTAAPELPTQAAGPADPAPAESVETATAAEPAPAPGTNAPPPEESQTADAEAPVPVEGEPIGEPAALTGELPAPSPAAAADVAADPPALPASAAQGDFATSPPSAPSRAALPTDQGVTDAAAAASAPADAEPVVAEIGGSGANAKEEPTVAEAATPAAPVELAVAAAAEPPVSPASDAQAVERGPGATANQVFYDGFLQHSMIVWIVGAVVALVFGIF